MDSSSFDHLARLFATVGSRRGLGGAAVAAVAGLLASDSSAAAARCPKGKKRCKKKCIPKRRCCTNGNCRPKGSGQICRRGRCQCPTGSRLCAGVCLPNTVCCGAECPPPGPCDGVMCGAMPNGQSVCQDGACVISTCDGAFADCNGDFGDGCEIDTDTHAGHCGACDEPCQPQSPNICGRNGTCAGGTCQLYGPETTCREAECVGSQSDLYIPAAVCSGTATGCPAPPPVQCAPYRCLGGAGCITDCAGNHGLCVSSAFCNVTACEPKRAAGGVCTSSQFCQSGRCDLVTERCCPAGCTPGDSCGFGGIGTQRCTSEGCDCVL